jgi:hypothetical protein
MVQGLTYNTISKAKIIETKLLLKYKSYLKSKIPIEKALATILVNNLTHHLEGKISAEQKKYAIVKLCLYL